MSLLDDLSNLQIAKKSDLSKLGSTISNQRQEISRFDEAFKKNRSVGLVLSPVR